MLRAAAYTTTTAVRTAPLRCQARGLGSGSSLTVIAALPSFRRTPLTPRQHFRFNKAAELMSPPTAEESAVEQSVTYDIFVVVQGARDQVRLYLTVVDENDPELRSETLDLSEAPTSEYERKDPTKAGTEVKLSCTLGPKFTPGVIILNKFPEPSKDDETPVFVATIELKARNRPAIVYSAYTYIDLTQSDRWIFPSSTAYPGFKDDKNTTPKGLQKFREDELKELQGEEKDLNTERMGAQRIYQYAKYNDLGVPGDEDNSRPVLGGNDFKYPRRLRTGRPSAGKDGKDESPPKPQDLPWLPQDEHFNSQKTHAFQGNTVGAAAQAARSIVGTPRGLSFAVSLIPFIQKMYGKTEPNVFTNLSIIDALFQGLEPDDKEEKKLVKGLLPVAKLTAGDIVNTLYKHKSKFDEGLKKALGLLIAEKDVDDMADKEDAPAMARPDNVGVETAGDKTVDVLTFFSGLLDDWPVPQVRAERAMEWRTDEEFGRSALAGQNPFSICAATEDRLTDTAITDDHVKGLIEEYKTLEECRKAKKLWLLDFTGGYKDFLDEVARLKENNEPGEKLKSVLYAGSQKLPAVAGYMNSKYVDFQVQKITGSSESRKDNVTVPIAIELKTAGESFRVFTPKQPQEVWLLAKTVISSLDSGVHQLISHWLRTHACVEPYIIATRRHLSVLNPVYKLLKPHFRYTLRINCNARKSLINAGGIVEQGFTPGPFSMRLSSVVYDSWRFNEQSLPEDLYKRGVAKKGADGLPEMILPNYRYAQDGILLWKAILQYVGDYLKLHYIDKSGNDMVKDDKEVEAWWNGIKNDGHPDIKKGWPDVKDVESLRDVLASIIWVASCHHAAVNFGQYDNSAYFPYKPSKITAKIPDAGSAEEKDLCNRFESVLLNSISDPKAAIAVMVTVKILSAHASDEEYLDRDSHSYIKDPEGVEIHKKFVDALKDAEEKMVQRNTEPESKGKGLPYTLLMPSNPKVEVLPGGAPVPRGIPYSISI